MCRSRQGRHREVKRSDMGEKRGDAAPGGGEEWNVLGGSNIRQWGAVLGVKSSNLTSTTPRKYYRGRE